jgi:hypothetical protein
LNAGDISVSSIANGTSNVDIIGVSGNVTTSVAGVANVLVVTSTGANITGTLSASGNITAPNFIGNIEGSANSATTAGTVTTAAQPNITSTGTLASLSVTGNIIGANVTANSYVFASEIVSNASTNDTRIQLSSSTGLVGINVAGNTTLFKASGQVELSGVGQIIGGTFGGSGITVAGTQTDIFQNRGGNVTVQVGTGGTIANTWTFTNSGNLLAPGAVSATGNVTGANLITGGIVSATGNVTASFFIGNGSQLTGLNTAGVSNGNSNVNIATANGNVTIAAVGNTTMTITGTGANISGTLSATSNITGGNIIANNLTSTRVPYVGTSKQLTDTTNLVWDNANQVLKPGAGGTEIGGDAGFGYLSTKNITASGNANIGNIGTGGLITATGNITGGNLVTAGILSVTGTGVSSIAGNLDMTSNTIINLATPTNPTDAATKQYVDDVAQGLDTKASVVAATTANITLSGTQTIDGVAVTAGQRVLVKNQTAPADNGLYLCAAGSWTRTTDMTTWAQVPGAYVFVETGTTQADTGWVCTADAGGTIGVTAMTWAQFSGAGSYTAGTGLTLTGTVFSANASQTQVTAVGTLTSLSVSGNANIGNIGTAGLITATGNVTGGNLISTGNVLATSAANVTFNDNTWFYSGYTTMNTSGIFHDTGANPDTIQVSTNSRANGIALVTQGLANSFIVSTGGIEFFTGGTLNANTAPSGGTSRVQITTTGLTANGIVSATGNITGGNVSGTLLTGTLTTAAQPNITSVGTLTSLSVSGQITNGNITTGASGTAGNLTGNWTLSAGSRLQATYADLAEKYVADATYAPGTVLIFGGDQEVTVANGFDSTRVAGVVTTNPAYIMNSGCEGEHVVNIALQGRVPVKVQGPVYKGDLLVSSTNGHATANNIARAGTIIGKSLENFTGESGTVEVAVGRF